MVSHTYFILSIIIIIVAIFIIYKLGLCKDKIKNLKIKASDSDIYEDIDEDENYDDEEIQEDEKYDDDDENYEEDEKDDDDDE